MAHLPQLAGDRTFITDGGLETVLIFQHGVELPEFASFPLLDTAPGRRALTEYFDPYFAVARAHDAGLVLDTPTWRASADWGRVLGYDAAALDDVNRRSVAFAEGLRAGNADVPVVVNGVIGPRGDGYVPGETMSAAEAEDYHRAQVRSLAGAEMVSAITMNYAAEAIGIVRAAADAEVPVAVSFTVETDGRLPTGQPLGEAVEEVDAATGGSAAYFMVNCAHPTHFEHVLEGGWTERVAGLRANASRMSHAELDAAEELDDGDPAELGRQYASLRSKLPNLAVVGGCCGTDERHVAEVCAALSAGPPLSIDRT